MSDDKQHVCRLCGADAELTGEGIYRHKSRNPWADQSGFCEKYGYPIPVSEKERPS